MEKLAVTSAFAGLDVVLETKCKSILLATTSHWALRYRLDLSTRQTKILDSYDCHHPASSHLWNRPREGMIIEWPYKIELFILTAPTRHLILNDLFPCWILPLSAQMKAKAKQYFFCSLLLLLYFLFISLHGTNIEKGLPAFMCYFRVFACFTLFFLFWQKKMWKPCWSANSVLVEIHSIRWGSI